jgi:DNA-binding CsgD family transcriptional regulator
MSEFNYILQKYTIKNSNKLKKICEPLQQHFNINVFWYTRTTESGRYFTICSNPEVHSVYIGSEHYKTNPFYRNPKLILPGYYSYRGIQDLKFQDSYDVFHSKFPIEAGNFAFKKQHELHVFGYGIKQSSKLYIDHVIANNTPILKKFNEYFLQEISSFVKKEDQEIINLASEMGESYNLPPEGMNTVLGSKGKGNFLESLKLISIDEIKKLSSRELECLEYLNRGLTTPQIADELALSKRTIEKYFESIKTKLRCHSKLELFEKANLLHLSDYF